MVHAPTVYDEVTYPSAVHPTTHPEHLAMVARLHGLAAADPRKARVLDIGGGDGMNVLAMAAAYPDGQYVSIDLAPSAVAAGEEMRKTGGFDNVRIEVADIVDVADSFEGEFDYVIAHGVYAWVPPVVQEAILRLIDRVLAPEGIADISYNALPGGYFRMALRDMLQFETMGITDPEERISRSLGFLRSFAEPREKDGEILRAMRRIAEVTSKKNPATLFHDEGGECYDPKSITEVVEAAAAHNLGLLNEGQSGGLCLGLPGEPMDDATLLRKAQAFDYANLAFFHHNLFIRPGRNPARSLEIDNVAPLFAELQRGVKVDGKTFRYDDDEIEIEDPGILAFIRGLADRAPERLALAPLVTSQKRADDLFAIAEKGIIRLFPVPFPGTLTPGERPMASRLARMQIASGEIRLNTLNNGGVEIPQNGPRQFLALLDGERDRNAIAQFCDAEGMPPVEALDDALGRMARAGLMKA